MCLLISRLPCEALKTLVDFARLGLPSDSTSVLNAEPGKLDITREAFYVRRVVYLMETTKVNAYIMYIFGKIELLFVNGTYNYFKMHYFNDFQEAKTNQYFRRLKYGRNMTFMDLSLTER